MMKRAKMLTRYNERTGQTKDKRRETKDKRLKDKRHKTQKKRVLKKPHKMQSERVSVEGVEMHHPESQSVVLLVAPSGPGDPSALG